MLEQYQTSRCSKRFLQRLLWNLGLCLLLSGVPLSQAREMQGRVGLGYNAQFANAYSAGYRLPGLSIKYGLNREFALEAVFAIATTNPINSTSGVKFFKNIFYESNLNFYFLCGAAFVSVNAQSGVDVVSGFGAEFFIPGLESLGFSVETGAAFNNSTGTYAIKTMGISFLDAGIHFYF